MSAETKSKDMKYYIFAAIGLIIMFGFSFVVQPFGPVTELGVKYLGIFIGLIWLWSTCDMGWPVFAAFVAMLVLKCDTVTTVLTGYSNFAVMMSIFTMMAIMPVAEASGMFSYIAKWLMNQKFIKGHPWVLSVSIFVLAFIAALINAGLVALFFCYDLVLKICDGAGMKRTSSWAGAMYAGITISAILGMMGMPFYAPALTALGIMGGAGIAVNLNFLVYIASILVYAVIMIALYAAAMKFIMRVDVAALKDGSTPTMMADLPPMSKQQKQYTIFTLAFIVAVVVTGSAGSLPANAVTNFLNGLGTVGVCFIFIAILLIWRIDGKPAFRLGSLYNGVMWDSVMIVWGAMVLAGTLTAEATGISTFLAMTVAPFFAGKSVVVFLILFGLVTLILTNFFNNMVIMILMFSCTAAIMMQMGINMFLVLFVLTVASQMGVLLPGASFYAGIYHGFADQIGRTNCITWGAVAMVVVGIALVIFIPLMVAVL